MSQSSINYMKTQMTAYFTKVKAALAANKSNSRFVSGTIAANSFFTYDAPTSLDFTSITHYPYSVGIQVSVNDPSVPTNPPVISADSILHYEIQADGKVIIRNNQTTPVDFYARFTEPVKR